MNKYLSFVVALALTNFVFAMSDSDELTQLISKAPKIVQECINKSITADEEPIFYILYMWKVSRAKSACDEAQRTVPECFGKFSDPDASILALSEDIAFLLYSNACIEKAEK